MGWVVDVALGVAIVVVVALVLFYIRAYRRNRALGTAGIVSRVRLTCPKCEKTFDFDFVPGASFTSLRLGRSRYMACPLCHQWSTFDMSSTRIPVTPRASQ
jgi:hypothetical protein